MPQPSGFLELPVQRKIPIFVVAQDRVAMHRHMPPNLMSASAPQFKLQEGEGGTLPLIPAKAGKTAEAGKGARSLSALDEIVRIATFVGERSSRADSPVEFSDAAFS